MTTAWRCDCNFLTGSSNVTQITGNVKNKNSVMNHQTSVISLESPDRSFNSANIFLISFCISNAEFCVSYSVMKVAIFMSFNIATHEALFKINCIVISQNFIQHTSSHNCWLIIVLKYKSKSISRLTNIFLFYCRYAVIDYISTWTFIYDLPTKYMCSSSNFLPS
jgi:hypothetical protein